MEPTDHLFFLDFDSHPIATGRINFKVLETKVTEMGNSQDGYYYAFSHLVERIE